jgi:hypothetical protein
LLGVLILLASASSAMPLLEAKSSKPLDEFGACFARAAERSDRAWAYLPGERGGTFTNSGARGVPASYWLQVRDAGPGTGVRLFADAPSVVADVRKAVDSCR